MANENLIKFCVTCGQRTKLITITSDGGILNNLKAKVATKFGLDAEQVTLRIKLNEYENLIDIDENDSEDVELLKQGGNVFLDTPQKYAVASSEDTSDSDVSGRQEVASTSSSHEINSDSITENGSSKCFNVKDIIQRHPRGKEIDEEYNTNSTITTETRRLLTSIVCAEMVKIFTYYPTKNQKIKVAQSIIQAYPTLRSSSQVPYDIWFDPCDSNRGYLSQKLNTMRRNLPRNELMRPRTKEGGDKISTSATSKTTKRKYTPLKEIAPLEEEELMLFCKRASRHETKGILEAMAASYSNRRNWITLKAPSVPEILARYPRLQDSPDVLQQEFKLMYPENGNKMITTWETRFCPHILQLAKMSRLPKIRQLYGELYKESVIDDDDDTVPDPPSTSEIALFSFIMAIYMVPSQTARRKSSLADSVGYFLVTRPIGTSVESHLAEERNAKKRRQPYLLGIGERNNPSQFFIVVDDLAIPCEGDITEAVDKLFKVHYVFNIRYADEVYGFFCIHSEFCLRHKWTRSSSSPCQRNDGKHHCLGSECKQMNNFSSACPQTGLMNSKGCGFHMVGSKIICSSKVLGCIFFCSHLEHSSLFKLIDDVHCTQFHNQWKTTVE